MKIDLIDKVTSFDNPVSDPLGNEDKTIMGIYKSPSKSKVDIPVVRKTAGLSDLNYTPYKPVNITGQAKKAYNYYLNRGVKPNVAAGIVGNLYKESGLNPMAVGDKGTAFGVAQWRGDRLSNLKKYASNRGRSHSDLDTQLDFILDEQGENQVLSLMGNQSPEVAAKTFADKYERPNPQYADYNTRSSVAKQLGKMKYGGKIQLYPNGGKVKPIIVTNPNDPRLKAYNDSNFLYRNNFKTEPRLKENFNNLERLNNYSLRIANKYRFDPKNLNYKPVKKDYLDYDKVTDSSKGYDERIAELKSDRVSKRSGIMPTHRYAGEGGDFFYKKPVQPVVYQPKTEPKEQVIQKGSLMDSKSRVVKTPKGSIAYSIPKYPTLQNSKPVVSQELPIESVTLPSEDKYVAPTVKQKEYTRGQQSYELNSDYVRRIHTENVTGKKMKPKLIRNAFGGFIPKYTLGAGEIMGLVSQGMGLVSQGMNLGAGFIDSTNDPENPNVAKSAISGFLKGNAALPGIGGILGGISSIRDAKKQRELFQKKKDIENRGVMDYFNIRSKGILGDYNTQGEQGSFYAKGGIPNPQYEVEHGEVIIGDDVKLTGGKQLASNLHKVVGKTHDQFNPNTVNGTGEDGSGGQFIFSNRLQLGGKTFANLAEGIAKQKSKAEEMMAHNDYIFKNTGQANAEIADAKLQQLAQIQEMMKGKSNPVGQFALGGSIPQYPDGKDKPKGNFGVVGDWISSGFEDGVPNGKPYKDPKSGKIIFPMKRKVAGIDVEYEVEGLENGQKISEIPSDAKTNPNQLTIQQRRQLRNSIPTARPFAPTTPQGTKTPRGNRLNLNKDKTKPVIDNPVRNQFNTLNPLTNKQIDNSVKLPNIVNKVVVPPIRKVDNTTGINENFSPVIGAALSGINYFANQNMINKYQTQTPVSLLQNPNYQYFDRSGTARNSVRGITNTIMNNPFLNQGTKQAALANSMNVMNDVNQQELNRKQEYDKTYRTQQLETENRNTMILNQARQQTMQNENQKQGLRQDNLNNLFSNINTNLSEVQANKQQDKAMQYMSLPYFKRLGLLTKEQQAEFMKNPISFLMGQNEVEVPKNKKGGRIKMKYC